MTRRLPKPLREDTETVEKATPVTVAGAGSPTVQNRHAPLAETNGVINWFIQLFRSLETVSAAHGTASPFPGSHPTGSIVLAGVGL